VPLGDDAVLAESGAPFVVVPVLAVAGATAADVAALGPTPGGTLA